jgi:hypothetical protein
MGALGCKYGAKLRPFRFAHLTSSGPSGSGDVRVSESGRSQLPGFVASFVCD